MRRTGLTLIAIVVLSITRSLSSEIVALAEVYNGSSLELHFPTYAKVLRTLNTSLKT